ncbi:MAG: hypothetical protein AAFQ43_00195 [Bacteroidota bacterium]
MSRHFSEQEAQRIFARIAEMQRADAARGPGSLSREDLEEAAGAAGLDPSYVARAIAELDSTPEAPRTLMGAPVEVVRQRVIPGPLTDEAWAAMVEAAREQIGQPGMAGQIGRLREWTAISGGTKNGVITRLSAEPTEAGVRIMISQSVRESVKGFGIASIITGVMSLVFGGMALAGVDAELWVAFGIMLAMATAFSVGSQVGSRIWAKLKTDQFDALMDRLDLIARSAHANPALQTASGATEALNAAPEARLDLDALGDAPTGDAMPSSRSRTRS